MIRYEEGFIRKYCALITHNKNIDITTSLFSNLTAKKLNLKNDTMYASVTNILLVFLTISFENIVAPQKSIYFFKKYFPPM